MAFIQFSHVSLAFGDRDILKDVSVNLQTGTKAALTGANGTGKSTLIKVMAGMVNPDSGSRICQKDTRIAYLPQSGLTHHGSTLLEEADGAFQFGYDIQEEIDRIGDELKKNPPNTQALLERQSALITALDDSGWHRRQALAQSILLGLGFSMADFSRKTEEFSGGWQMRIGLAKALMQNPDILLLDEPTNYLDIEARDWLEKFLVSYKGAFLLVSHDRYFLDVTVNEIYELFNGDLRRYPGNFSHYEQVRELEMKTLISEYEKQQAEIEKLQDFINRFGYKATKAAQAQERQKMLDKILKNKIEIPENLKKIRFTFPEAPHTGRIVASLKGISKSYIKENAVISDLNLTIECGERLVVAGKNGAGKSTLLRIIAGVDKNFEGEIVLGAGVKTGYFSQDSAETIAGQISVLDYMEQNAPLELIPRLRDMLGSFLFHGDDVFKSLDMLSGGEKSRIALLQLLMRANNFLILDEPTNHLDIYSKDVLLQALKDFGGTVIFVSHDRGFIESLSTKVLELSQGHHREFYGDYTYYQERLAAEMSGEIPTFQIEQSKNKAAENISQKPQKSQKSKGALSYEEAKKFEAAKRKAEKEVKKVEDEIARLESEKKTLETRLSLPEIYSNGEKARQVQNDIHKIDSVLEDLTKKWEESMQEAEKYAE